MPYSLRKTNFPHFKWDVLSYVELIPLYGIKTDSHFQPAYQSGTGFAT
jgi:hypothetical protein